MIECYKGKSSGGISRMNTWLSLELYKWNTSRVKFKGTIRSFKQPGNRSMPSQKVKGFWGNVNKYCVWYQNRSVGRWPGSYIRSQARGITLETRGVQESQVSIPGHVGYGPTVWVKSRKGGNVSHEHVSKTCQRIAWQLCRQQHRYQGRGTKRTIFLLVERGGPIGKVLIHRWLPECHQQ